MAAKLLVEGLDWGVDDAALRAAFAPFGRVVEAKVATDWETGRSRGFGHVVLDDETATHLAIETMDGVQFAGKVLRVMIAPEQERRGTYRGGDYGRVTPSSGASDFRGGDYSDGRAAPSERRVYRSADFGYAEGGAGSSDYRGGDYNPGRPRPKTEPASPAPPPRQSDAPDAEAAPAEAPAGEGATEATNPKQGGAKRGGWKEGNDQGLGGQGTKTFG